MQLRSLSAKGRQWQGSAAEQFKSSPDWKNGSAVKGQLERTENKTRNYSSDNWKVSELLNLRGQGLSRGTVVANLNH